MKVLKVVVLGADKVGKSSLLQKFLSPDNPIQPNLDSTLSKIFTTSTAKQYLFQVNTKIYAFDISELLRIFFTKLYAKVRQQTRCLIFFF